MTTRNDSPSARPMICTRVDPPRPVRHPVRAYAAFLRTASASSSRRTSRRRSTRGCSAATGPAGHGTDAVPLSAASPPPRTKPVNPHQPVFYFHDRADVIVIA